MYLPILFTISVIQAGSVRSDEDASRIFKGLLASEGQFPYMVPLWRKNVLTCSCSMITPTTVLAAAHCVVKKPNGIITPAKELLIKYGSVDSRKGISVNIRKVIPHPRYGNDDSMHGDLAILLTEKPLPPKVKQIALSSSSSPIGTSVTVVGWGATSKDGTMDYKLRFAKSMLIPQETCNFVKGSYNYKTRICSAKLSGSAVCPGDSGGPLVKVNENGEHITLGIASYLLETCFKDEKGVGSIYTSATFYLDWIKTNAEGNIKIIN